MSSSADFWANKIGQLRGVQPTSLEAETKPSEPTPAEANASKKGGSGLTFKAQKDSGLKSLAYNSSTFGSSTFGSTSPVTPSTATSWADSVEEDEAEAASYSYGASKTSQEYTLMAVTVARQAKRLEETEATVNQQAQRIVELNGELKANLIRIDQLEVEVEEKNARLAELETSVIDRDARIVDLTGQADEEARRAVHLEELLVKETATFQKLQLQFAERVSIPDSESSTEVEGAVDETTQSQQDTELLPVATDSNNLGAPVDTADTTAGAVNVTPEKYTMSQAASSGEDELPALSSIDFPALGSPTPVRDLRRSPFVTADNIKKVPPPPPARTLKLGIDPAKFQRKPAAGSGKSVFGSQNDNKGPPKIDINKDIRRMSKEEREPFGNGPIVQIMIGNETVAALPKFIFMQVSSKALAHWTGNPSARMIKFEAGSMTKGALNIQLEWITVHTNCNRVFSVSLKQENADRHNLELVRCARVLGLHSMYMGHFTRYYCEKVRDGPSKELIALIEELAYTDDEPIFDCLANYLAMQRSKAVPQELRVWDEQLGRLPKLATKMQEIQARKKFALGKSYDEVKEGLSPLEDAEEAVTMTVTADFDPDEAWRATGPAYV